MPQMFVDVDESESETLNMQMPTVSDGKLILSRVPRDRPPEKSPVSREISGYL